METNNSTPIYITALDGIINVNSLFTLAVFIGLTWDPTDPQNRLISNPICIPTSKVSESLISFHVYSFSSFLFSSLIALCIKQTIKNTPPHSEDDADTTNSSVRDRVNKTMLRVGMVGSAVGSVFGCGFLMMALVDVVQIKLGVLGSCPNKYNVGAVVPLLIFVPSALNHG
ncbi:hypothetical protein GIB67_007689 [Kingdonia uniflora]|uniref:Maternal effect embryo arrest 60 n=1 Tax=Kingdonia uniflora TaxID=39325 RepID=A0A7J7N2A6_9MAGN|nr:hypothetical protein GIB67_007689 [Kingdonia uniflora]